MQLIHSFFSFAVPHLEMEKLSNEIFENEKCIIAYKCMPHIDELLKVNKKQIIYKNNVSA